MPASVGSSSFRFFIAQRIGNTGNIAFPFQPATRYGFYWARVQILNERNTSRETDLDRLSRLKALSWLSQSELTLLIGAMALANYKRHSVILREVALARDAHILLAGIARITCRNARNERVTVAMLAPGPIPEFPPCHSASRGSNARLTTIAALAPSVGTTSTASR